MERVKKAKARERRRKEMDRARNLLQEAVDGRLDPYVAYRELYHIYCGNTPLHDEFRHFFRLPGIEPDGCFSVDEKFRETVRVLARKWLAKQVESA